MPGRRPPPRGFVVDANVLIDYADSDASLLALVGTHLGPLRVLLPVLAEVDQLSPADCERLGIALIEPDLAMLSAAAAPQSRISLPDRLCLLEAQANGLACVTNDRALRSVCLEAGVPVLWGLELLTELVARRVLGAGEALATARAMQKSNPRHITDALLARLDARLRTPPHPPPPDEPL